MVSFLNTEHCLIIFQMHLLFRQRHFRRSTSPLSWHLALQIVPWLNLWSKFLFPKQVISRLLPLLKPWVMSICSHEFSWFDIDLCNALTADWFVSWCLKGGKLGGNSVLTGICGYPRGISYLGGSVRKKLLFWNGLGSASSDLELIWVELESVSLESIEVL